MPNKQEVVKLNLMETEKTFSPSAIEKNTNILPHTPALSSVIAEVSIGSAQIKIYDGAQASQIQPLITALGGGSNAW